MQEAREDGVTPTPSAPEPTGPTPARSRQDVPFPVTLAVLALVLGFAATRVFGGLAGTLPWLSAAGSFATVLGVVLALAACARLVVESAGASRPLLVARLVGLAPVVVLVVAAMWAVPPHAVQWAALGGAAWLVALAALRGAYLARTNRAAKAALVLLAAGEVLELVAPPAHMTAVPGSFWPQLAERLGPVSEALAFVGVIAAAAWALGSTRAAVGPARTLAFSLTPASLALVLLVLPSRLPRTTEHVARVAFNARFDLVTHASAGHPSRGQLAVYTLLFSGLLLATCASLAAQFTDRGGAARRALGWICVLLAGFGAAGLAGLVDPLRVATLLLGVLLLEQAAALDEPAHAAT